MIKMAINRRYRDKKDYPTRQTGNVAQLMGLSDEGVRIYERYGLVYPDKKGDGGFRAFDIMDMVMLLYARVYRECGFSLKEVQHLANDCELAEVAQAYESSLVQLRQRVERERKRLERVEELLREIEEARTQAGVYTISTMPGMYRLEFLLDRKLDAGPEKQRKVRAWMEKFIPFTMLSTRYTKETIALPKEEMKAPSGLGIREDYAAFLGIQEDEYVKYYPPAKAVHTILQASNQDLIPDLDGCLSFLKDRGLTPAGDAIAFGIANLHFQTNFDRYFHLWIPIKEQETKRDGS